MAVADRIFTHYDTEVAPNGVIAQEAFYIRGNSGRGDAWVAQNEPADAKPDPDSERAEFPPSRFGVGSRTEFESLAVRASPRE